MTASQPGTQHLLLIEDNDGDAVLVSRYLSSTTLSHPFEVSRAKSLAEATELLQENEFDAILLDLGLPDGSGLENIRRVHEVSRDIAIIVLTGDEDDRIAVGAVAEGAHEFLSKNALNPRVLEMALKNAIQRAQGRGRLISLIENNSDAVLVISGERQIEFANTAAIELFEQDDERLVGSTFDFPVSLENHLTEIELPKRGLIAEMRVAEIEWDGLPALFASVRDVTDRNRAVELERLLLHSERLASIGQLAAGVAHEINNPAAYILGNLGYLNAQFDLLRTLFAGLTTLANQQTVDGSEIGKLLDQSEFAKVIDEFEEIMDDNVTGTKQIVRIVKDLRNYARIESDRFEEVDINSLIKAAVNITANELKHRASIVQELGPIPTIVGDRAKLSQVFVNLLTNAAHAIPAGARDQNVVTITTRQTNGRIEIDVKDTGIGMDPARLARVFEAFYTTKGQDVGTGLGLSISLQSVEKHQGKITAVSEPGVGSTFTVHIPCESGLEISDVTVVEPTTPQRRSRVLIIDDDEYVRRAYRRVLESVHDVHEVADGRDAIAKLEEGEHFHVIFCDVMMPDFDGVHVFEHLSKHFPDMAKRLVFLTGGAFTSRTKEFLENPSLTVLEKPVSEGLLIGVVDRIRGSFV